MAVVTARQAAEVVRLRRHELWSIRQISEHLNIDQDTVLAICKEKGAN